MAAEFRQILVELGLEQDFADCLRAGFQNWDSLSNITEAQLATTISVSDIAGYSSSSVNRPPHLTAQPKIM
jgi:hypothetical protein